MMKSLSVSAVLALALAGAAHALPQESTSDEDGFNLFAAGENAQSADEGWQFGEGNGTTADGFTIPDTASQDLLSDISEIPTDDLAEQNPLEVPEISEAEDDLIRLD